MRITLFLILNILLSQIAFGQSLKDTLVTKEYLDSLKREITNQKERNNFFYWGYQLKANVVKVDTAFIRSDSSVISHYSINGKPIMKESATYNKQKQKVQYVYRFYDDKEQVRYIEHWNVLKDDTFDSKLDEKERMEYDNTGRLILHVIYSSSIRSTIKKIFSYDYLGNQQQMTAIFDSYRFWESN